VNLTALHARANELIGLPYAPKGRDPTSGVDCTWVLLELFRAGGHPLPNPGTTDEADEALALFGDRLEEVDRPEVGGLVVLYREDKADHAAVVVRHGYVIHACEGGVRRTRLAIYTGRSDARYYRAAV
jgi:cell wall-associated NlpC family hydrolase